MPYKRSFNLNKDDKQLKSSERLYQPKTFRWCKYIVLPLLVGFVLLMILTNVDFTGEAYSQYWEQSNARINSIDDTVKETLRRLDLSLSRAVNCLASINSCSLTCSGGNVNNFYKELELLYELCQRDLDLFLIDCLLPSGKLKDDFFAGNYYLNSININNCNLNGIEDKTFQAKSVKNLKNLVLLKTQFAALNAFTFKGLLQLESFQLVNEISWSNFKGERFLKPISKTLKLLIIQQESSKGISSDPLMWLQGNNLKQLKNVTLANNNFGNKLKQETFSTLISVEYLDLSNSGIRYLPANTFDTVLNTLKYLDLSSNHLTLLAGEMLLKMSGLALNLSFNFWDCSCINKQMLQIIQWHLVDIEYIERTNSKCSKPFEGREMLIEEVQLNCLIRTAMENSEYETETETVLPIIPLITSAIITNQTKISISSESSLNNSKSSSINTSDSDKSISSKNSHETDTKDTPTNTEISVLKPLRVNIYCRSNGNNIFVHPIAKEKFRFSIRPQTDSAIKVIFQEFVENIAVLFFTAADVNVTVISNVQQQQNEYFILINNLQLSANYVFCVVPQLVKTIQTDNGGNVYDLKVSPLDCRSYSQSEVIEQQYWLQKKDQVWILSLVAIGTCLLFLFSITLTVIFIRWRNFKAKSYRKTFNHDLKIDFNSHQMPHGKPYLPRIQPPDVVAQYVDFNVAHNLYEELIN